MVVVASAPSDGGGVVAPSDRSTGSNSSCADPDTGPPNVARARSSVRDEGGGAPGAFPAGDDEAPTSAAGEDGSGGGVEPGGVAADGGQPGRVEPGGVEPGGVEPGGVEPGGVE